MKFYICKGCGKIVGMVQPSKCPTKCCGEPMEEMIPNTTYAAVEKHVPVVEIVDGKVIVTVGEVAHPMAPEHYIEWIAISTDRGNQRKMLEPGDEPKACFCLAEGEKAVAVYEYCNLHGLWKKEL